MLYCIKQDLCTSETPLLPANRGCACVQAAAVYEAALSALEAAGATLVEFELTPFFEQTLADGVGGFDLNINYEMPRELARCGESLHLSN